MAYTRKEFEAHQRHIEGLLRTEVKPLFETDPVAAERRRQIARDDKLYFARVYLPHYFYDGFAPFHPEMSRAAQTAERPVLVVGFGGCGKSTLITLVETLHACCFGTNHMVVIGSATEDIAAQPTALAKMELEENEIIRADFGDLKGSRQWEDGDFVTSTNVRVKARGAGQAFRGLRWRQFRPDLVILDDIEDHDISVSSRRTEKVLTWILSTILPRMDVKGWRLVIVANILNRTGVIGSLLHHPDYNYITRKVFPAEDEKGKSTWPARFSKNDLSVRKKIMGHVRYSGEMLCKPIDDTHYFRPEMTVYGNSAHLAGVSDVIAFIDPSVLASTAGDYKAIIATGRLAEDHRQHVCGAWVKHGTIGEMINACYRMYDTLKPKVFVLESNGYQEHLKRDFDLAAQKFGYSLPIAAQSNVENKDLRIERLVPLHDGGDLVFYPEVGDTRLLLEQLYQWEPRGKEHDDGPDALAGANDYRSGRARRGRFRRL